jgi:hypothetical protein
VNRRIARPAHVTKARAADEGSVVRRERAVWEHGRVLEAGADAVAALERALVDRPAGDAVTVVNLLQGDAGGREDVLHGGGVRDGLARVGVQRLDKNSGEGHAGAAEISRRSSDAPTDAGGLEDVERVLGAIAEASSR